jgi:hypothetical protein
MCSRWTLMSAGWRFGVSLLVFLLIVLGLWWTFRNSAPEQTVQHLHSSSKFHSSRKPSRSQSSLFVIRHLGDRQRASFAVFRTSPEPLPWSVRRDLGRPIYGINWRLAQRLPIRVPAHGWRMKAQPLPPPRFAIDLRVVERARRRMDFGASAPDRGFLGQEMGQEPPQTPADPSRSRSRENRLKPCST